MSDAPDKDSKQFAPSDQRLRKARQEGNVFRSTETVAVGMLVTSSALLAFLLPLGFDRLRELMREMLLQAGSTTVTDGALPLMLVEWGAKVGLLLAPFFGILLVAGVLLNVFQTGLSVSSKAVMPKASRISPASGFKRIFSSRGLFELMKSVFKLAAIGWIAYADLAGRFEEMIQLPGIPLVGAFELAGSWVLALVFKVLGVLALITGVDFAYQKWRYTTDLKMTLQEVREEAKESEGDPHVKAKRRQEAARLLKRPRLSQAVPKADVVVTNPTHFAVALRYDPDADGAPKVLVKGTRKRALRIKALAAEHGVPTVENVPLARALYRLVPEDQEIPADLYAAVAAVLAEVYRRRGNREPGNGSR